MENKKMSKYFVVNDRELAVLMRKRLKQNFYVHDRSDGSHYYTFKRVEDIEHVYSECLTILGK